MLGAMLQDELRVFESFDFAALASNDRAVTVLGGGGLVGGGGEEIADAQARHSPLWWADKVVSERVQLLQREAGVRDYN